MLSLKIRELSIHPHGHMHGGHSPWRYKLHIHTQIHMHSGHSPWRYKLYIHTQIHMYSRHSPWRYKLYIHTQIHMHSGHSPWRYKSYIYTHIHTCTVDALPEDHHHRSHLSLNRKGRWGTTDDFPTSFLHFPLFSTALWDLANSRPVHSLMLSSHLFLCRPCLLPPFTVPCKMVLIRPDEWETCPYHYSLRLFTMNRRSSSGPIACWLLAWTSSLVTWSLYEMCSILR